ncbi:MAG: thiamine pyrophosphate-dependent enzyme [bacterium]|nr:thiamine pyrophosphate-dependent enzyme [bacterium]
MIQETVNLLTDARREYFRTAWGRCELLIPMYKSWRGTALMDELRRAYDEALYRGEHFPVSLFIQLYKDILLTRVFFDEIKKHLSKTGDGTIPGPAFSGHWQEVAGVAAGRTMRPDDYGYPDHRSFSFYVVMNEDRIEVRGASLRKILYDAWMNHLCKKDGPTRGHEGNIHFSDLEHHNFGFGISTMGISACIGPGPVIPAMWEKAKKLGRELLPDERIAAVTIFGDGAASNGVVHEGMNLAKAWNIGALFVCHDNEIALSVPSKEQHGGIDLVNRAVGYEMPGIPVDGRDAVLTYLVNHWLLMFSRRTSHPSFMKVGAFRKEGHNLIEDTKYAEEVYGLDTFREYSKKKHDPLAQIRTELVACGILDAVAVEKEIAGAHNEVGGAYDAALRAEDPARDRNNLTVALIDPECRISKELAVRFPLAEPTQEYTLREAYRRAIREELGANELFRYYGEDVADPKGGVLGLTLGLSKEFPKQVRNMPIAESAGTGHAVGSGMFGYPVCMEFQFLQFTRSAGEIFSNYVPTVATRTGRGANVTFVGPGGKVPSSNNSHSARIEIDFAALPGMKVLEPATVADMIGMVKSAIRDPDACYIIVPIHELGMRERVSEKEFFIPLGVALVRRAGSDATLVTYGALMLKCALAAAEELEKRGVSLEVIDLRTIKPWDKETVFASVEKTGRVIIMHEASKSFHAGAEFSASIGEEIQTFHRLRTRIVRLAAADTQVPVHPNLEDIRLPQVDEVVAAALRLMEES